MLSHVNQLYCKSFALTIEFIYTNTYYHNTYKHNLIYNYNTQDFKCRGRKFQWKI